MHNRETEIEVTHTNISLNSWKKKKKQVKENRNYAIVRKITAENRPKSMKDTVEENVRYPLVTPLPSPPPTLASSF